MRGHAVSREEYLDPTVASGLPWRDLPIVDIDHPTVASLASPVIGDPHAFDIPIVPWPATGGRPIDPDTGTGGGVISGEFRTTWVGDRLTAVNEAVGGQYVLGFATAPEDARETRDTPPEQILLWHVNHHPDGGQLFWPLDGQPFLVPAIAPGDDPDLDTAVAIRSDGSMGICLHPSVWHDGVYPESGDGRFLTRQGAVHARVSCDIGVEFGVLLRIPLPG